MAPLSKMCISIGNDQSTLFWYDKWLTSGAVAIQLIKDLPIACSHIRVSYFLEDRQWNVRKLIQWVSMHLIHDILQCPLSLNPSKDNVMTWHHRSYASFSMSRAYRALRIYSPASDVRAMKIWTLWLVK